MLNSVNALFQFFNEKLKQCIHRILHRIVEID